nr:PH, RCC1 and FYVE domains-containing protein 1-like isoform X1 [Ipomoea batatas]
MINPQRNSLGDRNVEQAIIAIKRGSYLLKYGSRGKPKFCPFRLSTDETRLIWYHGEEKNLQLSHVSTIIPGQRTATFQRYPRPDKEYQSFSLIYDGKHSLDLICKDKNEAEIWCIALRALISRDNCEKWRSEKRSHSASPDSSTALTQQSSPSILSSSSSSNIVNEDQRKNQFVLHPYESPPQKRLERALSDMLLYNDAAPCSPQKDLNSNSIGSRSLKNINYENGRSSVDTFRVSFSSAVSSSSQRSLGNFDTDILIWGERTGDDLLGGGFHSGGKLPSATRDALLPKTLESALVLDAQIIACGSRHAVLITKLGETFSWGEGSFGQLGHGVESDIYNPKLINTLSGLKITSAACGEYHTCAITVDGELYTWGDGTYNFCLLGHGTGISHWTPKKVRGPLEDKHVSMVSCGPWHSAVVTSMGQLFTFGDGTFGALGHGDHCNTSIPREVETLEGLRTLKVSCGYWHTAAIVEFSLENSDSGESSTGRLFTWGNGNEGQLGHGDEASRLVPCCITMLDGTNFCQVACGHSITVALTTSGQVYTMGSSDYGQLGIPESTGKLPSCVHGKIKNSFIEKIACGSFHVAVLSSQSEVYTWGKGGNGQLGHGENYDRSTPTRVEALKDRCIKSVVCGKNFTAVTCLHKEVSIADYSIICSGCSRPFNFRRKCHNCYNCGLVFCNTCTSKKSLKASLAPSMHKPYRVCEDCFAKLNKGLDVALSTLPPKALASHKSFSEQKEKESVHTKPKSLLSRLLSFDSFRWPETWHSKKNQKQDSSFSRTPNGSPQFDRSCVSSPASMRDYSDKTPILIPGTPNHSLSGSPVSIKPNHSHSFSVPCNFSLVGSPQVLSNARDTSEDHTKELSILREQVETLTSRSHFLEVELKTTLKQLMEAHEVARVETRKNIAAKEVIRCLVTQLKDLAARLPHDTSSCRNSDPFIDDTLNTLCVSPWWSKLSN